MKTFEESAELIKTAQPVKQIDDKLKLEFYSLYKQATVGNINTERPGMFDFKGKAKWDAWKEKENIEQKVAKEKYVKLVSEYYLS